MSSMVLLTIILTLVAYLLGSIPFGYMIGRVGYQIDIRDHGSKNIGFTNVLRTLGVFPGVITLIGDIGKGASAVLLARWVGLPDVSVVIAGLAVVAGHNWSVFLGFRAGRGVATGFGVALALTWQPTLILIVLWGVIVAVTRYISLASIVCVALYPLAVFYLKLPMPYVIMGVIGAVAIIWQHRMNIVRLMKGEESKIGTKKES